MGGGQSVPSLQDWVAQTQRQALTKSMAQVPKPTITNIPGDYASVVLYAYGNPKGVVEFLKDIQRRYFLETCKFRWSWSEERPETSLKALLSVTPAAKSAQEANDAYKRVVEAIQKDPAKYKSILEDMNTRYFDPRFGCPQASVKQQDFTPVFR